MMRGAIFDMDGLMFDTEKLFAISWAEQARRFGFAPIPEFHRAVCGTSGTLARDTVRKFYPGISDANAFINDGCDRVAEMMAESVPEKRGLHEILDYLKGIGLRLAVASSSEAELIRANLAKTGLEGQFDVLLSTSQVARGKPAPDVFLEAARQLGLRPEGCKTHACQSPPRPPDPAQPVKTPCSITKSVFCSARPSATSSTCRWMG